MPGLEQFHKQNYLNLETYRRNGEAVRTPVWFAQYGERLYVVTGAGSGKVKRIRREGRVRIAACRMDGRLTGSWLAAAALEIDDPQVRLRADQLLNRKYGLIKKFFDRQRARSGAADTVLEITLSGQDPG